MKLAADYEVTYITQSLTTRERLIRRLNRLITGIFAALNPADHPVKKLYDNAIEPEIDHILRANDPAGLYAYCLNCNVH
jgi:hypothetical protein